MKAFHILLTLSSAFMLILDANAQTSAERLLARADSARLEYDFPTAADLCQ